MSHELFYTSAPRGLFPGSRGFCTVAATQHLPKPLAEKLEALSGYRPLFPPVGPEAALNPVAMSHLRVAVAGKTYSVLSRVAAAGLDYSERTNKLAHHVVLDGHELPRGGPLRWKRSTVRCGRSCTRLRPRGKAGGRPSGCAA
jgi:hypothetical protein